MGGAFGRARGPVAKIPQPGDVGVIAYIRGVRKDDRCAPYAIRNFCGSRKHGEYLYETGPGRHRVALGGRNG